MMADEQVVSRPLLRSERPGDEAAIAAVIEAAFGQRDEAELVARLRAAAALPVSLLAELDDHVLGHVALSPVAVDGADGQGRCWLGLAPLAVRPEHQRRGIGTALVTAALDAARARGAAAVFVLGRPSYYGRRGFEETTPHGWSCTYPAPPAAFRVHTLDRHLLPPPGTVHYHPAFDAL